MQTIVSQPSVARWFRQWCFVPILHHRWLTKAVKAHLTQKVSQAEQGHRGEICVIIENHLPMATAYRQDCRERALALFASQRVWDTADNTGVLIYMNLCEHDLQIIADRGINQKIQPEHWQALCHHAIAQIQAKRPQQAIEHLIDEIGHLLRQHYPDDDLYGNELPDSLVHLR